LNSENWNPSTSQRKQAIHLSIVVVVGGVLTPSAAILGKLCGRKRSDRFHLTSLPCSTLTYSSSASAPSQCTAWRLQAVRTARCTMGTEDLSSQSRKVGISDRVGAGPAPSSSGTWSCAGFILLLYLICRDHFALELEVHGPFSITGEVLYVWGYLLLLCMAVSSYVRKGVSAAGAIRTGWETLVTSTAFYGFDSWPQITRPVTVSRRIQSRISR